MNESLYKQNKIELIVIAVMLPLCVLFVSLTLENENPYIAKAGIILILIMVVKAYQKIKAQIQMKKSEREWNAFLLTQ